MKARDVMTREVITVSEDGSVQDVANLLLTHGISGVPVVGSSGELKGIITEGDLIRRVDGQAEQRSWWLSLFTTEGELAEEFVKEHSRKVVDVMTRDVITARPETPLGEIARLLETKRIKRVPIVEDGRLVGIVSRANLVQALAGLRQGLEGTVTQNDAAIRDEILERLRREPWGPTIVNVTVHDGRVDLWGLVRSDTEKKAARVAAETTPGVVAVDDNLIIQPRMYGV